MKITDLLKDNEKVYFSILQEDKETFLELAKDEGFKWISGDEIKPGDGCNGHMAVHRDMKMANVAWFCWFHPAAADIPKYDFAEFLKGNLVISGDKLVSYTLNGKTTVIAEE